MWLFTCNIVITNNNFCLYCWDIKDDLDEDWILAVSAVEYGGGGVRSVNVCFEIDSPGVIVISSIIDFSILFRTKWEKITFSDFY